MSSGESADICHSARSLETNGDVELLQVVACVGWQVKGQSFDFRCVAACVGNHDGYFCLTVCVFKARHVLILETDAPLGIVLIGAARSPDIALRACVGSICHKLIGHSNGTNGLTIEMLTTAEDSQRLAASKPFLSQRIAGDLTIGSALHSTSTGKGSTTLHAVDSQTIAIV